MRWLRPLTTFVATAAVLVGLALVVPQPAIAGTGRRTTGVGPA